ncbi:putative U-box domain-containing protein 50 [Argentina anserina]|uniref:putative U-box domain-containing protein 50 n=1 Tax=Argentina anserina TaxID=57926 RepID=UPI002176617C|nr:putative U-box domain-containing protein 50 [Potentilla anserina]
MEGQEKVYVALGNQLQDGIKTLEWTLRKWRFQPISIVILHVTNSVSVKDYVSTPFGKLPASSVSDVKLKILRKLEQEKIDKILSKYIAFCGKARVKVEILNVERYDDPIHMRMLDLISGLHMTKLVMGFLFMKSSSWKPKTIISGLLHIHQYKPESCELFIICGGKEVFVKGENDKKLSMGDDQETMVARMKDRASISLIIGSIFGSRQSLPALSTRNHPSNSENMQWENSVQEIEIYMQQLCSNADSENHHEQESDTSPQASPTDATVLELNRNPNLSIAEKIESLKIKVREAHQRLQLKKKEVQASVDRRLKAEWAISLCKRRAEELEVQIKNEVKKRIEIKKELDKDKDFLHEVKTDVEESKNKLNSLIELRPELSRRLHISKMAKACMEVQLENEITNRAEMVREIEELRRERDVFQRRVEFCREKGDVRMAGKSSSDELSCCLREYTVEEIELATDNYSRNLLFKTGRGRSSSTTVYKGRINHDRVAIKLQVINPDDGLPRENFQAKVKLISQIRHPHLLAMIGYCSELNCIVYEYMHHGSLQDVLFSSPENSVIRKCRVLTWHDRIRIATEVCSALCYFHQARPKPIIHGHLSPSKIFLDRNLVAKVGGFGLNRCYYDESHVGWDIRAFGVVIMNLLIGRNLVDDTDCRGLVQALDESAGPWPSELSQELAGLVSRCLSVKDRPNVDLKMMIIMEELDVIKKKADDLVAKGYGVKIEGRVQGEVSNDVPSVFLCPIFQEIMKDPHVAADGFSYEREAIGEWFRTGHNTSPMTNLQLKHTILVPNLTLRSLIRDWHCKRSLTYPH